MARPLRIEFSGACYHVMNRGGGRKVIFSDDKDRVTFLRILDDVFDTHHIEIHAYCLMNTHYHLLMRTPEGNLGSAMRQIDGLYTQHFNRAHRTDGPLFRGRYKAILVDGNTYLAHVSRYIHLNPVDAGVAQHAEVFPWSSCQYFVRTDKPPRWLDVGATLALFGPRSRATRLYGDFILEGVDAETRQFYGKRRQEPILGDDAFRKRLEKEKGDVAIDPEVPGSKFLRSQVPLDRIINRVAAAFQVDPGSLLTDGRGRRTEALPRIVAMALCRRPGGHALTSIAKAFGTSYSGVSVAGKRLAEKSRKNNVLTTKMDAIIRDIFFV
jgi:putative transposase